MVKGVGLEETDMKLGICVFGIPYTCGLIGKGTDHANPNPLTYYDVLDLAVRYGVQAVEIPPERMLPEKDAELCRSLREKAAHLGLRLITGGRMVTYETLLEDIQFAADIGSEIVRCKLSNILCGDRKSVGLETWNNLLKQRASVLKKIEPVAAEHNVRIAIENHQDATSDDLAWLCEEVGSPFIGITLDTGNTLGVCEDPVNYARKVQPYIVHVHIKDYIMVKASSGFLMVHCPIGSGIIDIRRIVDLLENNPNLTLNIELAALYGREVRILEDDYWSGYPPRELSTVLPVFRFLSNAVEGDYRTPWESGKIDELAQWELDRLEKSIHFMRRLLGQECMHKT